MKKIHSSLVWLCYTLCTSLCCAQTITFPSDRAVFQRDQANQAVVTIAGFFNSCQDKVEARFVPIQSHPSRPAMGQAAPTGGGWQVIQNAATCGNFRGTMTVLGGWYRLEVRGIKNGNATPLPNVDHVGVGEVFLVAGQSNATGGDSNSSGPGATEDAVSSVNFQNATLAPYSDIKLDSPNFVHLDQNTKTAPFGNYAWCWGEFGDKLVKTLNVPVMIFNAGWSATGIVNWKESIPTNGITQAWFGSNYPAGLPFGHLRIALNNYIAQLGIRAVLWHQGETDTFVGTSQSTYRNHLRSIISESRALSGKPNLAWVVARASRYSWRVNGDLHQSTHVSANVIAAQNDVMGLGSNGADPNYKLTDVFGGPETDPFWSTAYRSDSVHFVGSGLSFLAQLWADKLNTSFLSSSTPYAAISPPNISITQSNNTFDFDAEAGWSVYNWLPQPNWPIRNYNQVESSSKRWSPGSTGWHQLKTLDAYNNAVLSPVLYVSSTSLPVTWKYFKGTGNMNLTADLNWATSEEDNTAFFELERANAVTGFEKIATLTAAGNSNESKEYAYRDQFQEAGTYYYRVKQIDLDGQNSYSRIISIQVSGKASIKLFPNPVVADLSIQSEKTIQSIEVYNSLGLKVYYNNNPVNFTKLDMSRYQPGVYLFKINGESFRIVR